MTEQRPSSWQTVERRQSSGVTTVHSPYTLREQVPTVLHASEAAQAAGVIRAGAAGRVSGLAAGPHAASRSTAVAIRVLIARRS